MDYKSVFDINIKDQNGNQNMLEKYRGKVLMFVNTTGHCGNASQWPILNKIMDDYRDKNFQIIYVPTNDYCGSVTVEPYKDGITCGGDSFKFANKEYGIEDPFTQLLSSRNEPWFAKVDDYESTGDWKVNYELHPTLKQKPKDDLFIFLDGKQDGIGGNFHKFITNSKGVLVTSIDNYILNIGPRPSNKIEIIDNKILLNTTDVTELIETVIKLEDLNKLEYPKNEIRKILFEMGEEKIFSFNPKVRYSFERELHDWYQKKDIFPNIQDFRNWRAEQDIIKMKKLIDEILLTDKSTISHWD